MNNETQYWQALQTRDANFDGVFFYGVTSTGIYCRPICPSKLPKRENVLFFVLPEAAQLSGFRDCLRCQPKQAVSHHPQAKLIQQICAAISATPATAANLATLSAQIKLSPAHLQRVFKKLMGISPRQYAEALRISNFKLQIKNGSDVTAAMYEAGFSSSSRLYEKAAAQLGMTPATYRKGGKAMSINYTITDCSLGKLLVATTERGICAVTLGDSSESLTQALFEEFPQAEIHSDEKILRTAVNALLKYLAGQQPQLDLPLDVQATAFQKRVWEELRRIPYGQTASYTEIAQRLNQPTAARAVARACATNPVALINPCHRVIRGNGELSGYRWGIERKQKLLAQERDAVPASIAG